MFAQLGEHIFEGGKAPSAIHQTYAVKYGRISLVNRKDASQFNGEELDEIQLTVNYHHQFCNPSEEIRALRESMSSGEILPFLWGDGTVVGNYTITSVEVTGKQYTDIGQLLAAEVSIDLLEYADGEEPEPRGLAVRPAVTDLTASDAVPAAEPPAEPVPSPANSITSDVGEAKTKVSGIKNALSNVKKGTSTYREGVRDVRKLSTSAAQLFTQAKNKVEATQKIVQRATDLPSSLGEAITYAENLAKVDDVVDIRTLEQSIDLLADSTDKISGRMGSVVAFSATREGGN
ncbi:MAG: phage tail protein [Alistipes sp.]|nr:phage tail protein [Alistipes sp.]